MMSMHAFPRCIVVATAGALIAALPLAAACSGDSEPEPTPTAAPATATPTPTPTPTPTAEPTPTATPTPAPATATPTPEAAEPLSMRDFVVDASTTGQDLIDRLSEDEAACIKAAVGDFVFEILLGTPLLMAGTDAGGSAQPLFACLSVENVVLLGLAFSDAQTGFRDDESRECIQELALEHPEIIFTRLRLEWEGAGAHPDDIQKFIVRLYDCWSDEERVAYLVDTLDLLAEEHPYPGRELIALLPESEVACVMERLPGEQYETFLASSLGRGFGDQLHECFSDESHAQMFIALTNVRSIGGWSEETAACLLDFAREHPHFVEIATTLDLASLPPAEFAEIGRDGVLMMECLSEDEIVRLQGIGASNLAAP